MLTQVGVLQGNDIPVASSNGRYLVNEEGQLVTMGPTGPASISQIPATQSAALSFDGLGWATASFADGTKYVVATECAGDVSGPQQWVADLVPIAGGKDRILGQVTNAAGDPESAAAIVSGPASSSAAGSQNQCQGPQQPPDKAISLREPGQQARTIITAADLTGALGWSPGTPVLVTPTPDPAGNRLALSVVVDNSQQLASGQARQAVVVITRTGQLVAHMSLPADARQMQWSPDGQRLAVCQASQHEPSSVAVWTVGGAARTVLLPGRHDLECNQLLWSPDGNQLMYAGVAKAGGLNWADDLQPGWTVIDLRSGRTHDVTAPGQPAAWLPATASGTR
jgi:WD40 repeat protein